MCVNEAIYGNVERPNAVSLLQDTISGSPLPPDISEIKPVSALGLILTRDLPLTAWSEASRGDA